MFTVRNYKTNISRRRDRTFGISTSLLYKGCNCLGVFADLLLTFTQNFAKKREENFALRCVYSKVVLIYLSLFKEM